MLVRIARIFAVEREPTTRTVSPGLSFIGVTGRPCHTPDGRSHPGLVPASCICPALCSRTTAYPDSDTHQSLCSPRPLRPGSLRAGSVSAQFFLWGGRGRSSSRRLRLANFPVGRTISVLLGLCLRHVGAALCDSVPPGAGAMIDTGVSVNPNLYVGIALIFSLRCGRWLALGE